MKRKTSCARRRTTTATTADDGRSPQIASLSPCLPPSSHSASECLYLYTRSTHGSGIFFHEGRPPRRSTRSILKPLPRSCPITTPATSPAPAGRRIGRPARSSTRSRGDGVESGAPQVKTCCSKREPCRPRSQQRRLLETPPTRTASFRSLTSAPSGCSAKGRRRGQQDHAGRHLGSAGSHRPRRGVERRAEHPITPASRRAGVQGLARDRGHLRWTLLPQDGSRFPAVVNGDRPCVRADAIIGYS